jgi:hypothetical protein
MSFLDKAELTGHLINGEQSSLGLQSQNADQKRGVEN